MSRQPEFKLFKDAANTLEYDYCNSNATVKVDNDHLDEGHSILIRIMTLIVLLKEKNDR